MRFRVRIAGEPGLREVAAESSDEALRLIVAEGLVPLGIAGDDDSLVGRVATLSPATLWRWWREELRGALHALTHRDRLWLDAPELTFSTQLVERSQTPPEPDGITATRRAASGGQTVVLRRATLSPSQHDLIRARFPAQAMPALWTRIDDVPVRLLPPTPPPHQPWPRAWGIAAALLATIPVTTLAGATFLAGQVRVRPPAIVAAPGTNAMLIDGFRRAPASAILAALGQRLPENTRLISASRAPDGQVFVDLATADPDLLRPLLAADPLLARFREVGQAQDEAGFVIRLAGTGR